MKLYDIIVIGSGIMGLAHAYHASNLGLRVLILEKNSRAAGSSVQNFGQVVPSGFGVEWQRIGRVSLEYYRKIQSEWDITARNNGSIYFATDPQEEQLLEELMSINRIENYSSVLLNKEECYAKYAGINMDHIRCGLFFPEEISLDSPIAIASLSAYLQIRRGVEMQFQTVVSNVESDTNQVLLTDHFGRTYQAQIVIICNGSEFKLLYPKYFENADLEMVKLQMMQVSDPGFKIGGNLLTGYSIRRYESFHECPSYMQIKKEENPDTFAKQFGIHLLFKQNLDGSIILGDSHEYAPPDRWEEIQAHVTQQCINQFMMDEANKYINIKQSQIIKTWIGIYSQVKDKGLINVEIEPNVHIACAIGGKGMTASLGFAKMNMDQIYSNL
ncbi:MAG: TIGR03364 family FAD-dependent oxidoreductase [Saprospiraceae bacterium]|nr:TIGR03364 family FAD-dependent oxidoreductase [Saprospiraceae bacterium]